MPAPRLRRHVLLHRASEGPDREGLQRQEKDPASGHGRPQVEWCLMANVRRFTIALPGLLLLLCSGSAATARYSSGRIRSTGSWPRPWWPSVVGPGTGGPLVEGPGPSLRLWPRATGAAGPSGGIPGLNWSYSCWRPRRWSGSAGGGE